MSDLPEGFKPNPGECPAEAVGKRVRVILRDPLGTGHHEPSYSDANTQAVPGGWAADGRGGCRWAKRKNRNDPFDIVAYRVM